MRITFVTDLGQTYTIEIDPQMELENIMALLEAEVYNPFYCIPTCASGSSSLTDRTYSLVFQLPTKVFPSKEESSAIPRPRWPGSASKTRQCWCSDVKSSSLEDAEMMRLQILGDPSLMAQLRETQPELADAAANHPERFAQLLRQQQARQQATESARKQEIEALNADPFDVEAQRRIEEAIRQQAVMENLEHAMEYSPESFGRVHML
ncbi:hypothetical protein BOTBODRAFT_569995 [Botryobasidium botryosum FD-172 SS1]|uniref:Ddi1/2 HDD domain-containing protein n=1 Tax=Botryobasidium botryosum (strain FD-172 SS1) TaxID=930990 RepID=A0A067M0M8_BOTB1|nr:hypothetical protein BOTBODRAFT_569995 [Botryobasidium botryosum FD-172 SS1]